MRGNLEQETPVLQKKKTKIKVGTLVRCIDAKSNPRDVEPFLEIGKIYTVLGITKFKNEQTMFTLEEDPHRIHWLARRFKVADIDDSPMHTYSKYRMIRLPGVDEL